MHHRMNPLPRILGLSLFVVLSVLTVFLATPMLLGPGSAPVARQDAAQNPASTKARLAAVTKRFALPLALTGLVLTGALLVSLALRSGFLGALKAPVDAARAEIGALTNLAKTSVAQGEALTHERHSRQRAEEDARLQQQLLMQSLEQKIRLGHDLHDGVIQSLYAAGLTIESARSLAQTNPSECDRRLAQCLLSLNATIRDVRAYISGLSPELLRSAGFDQAVNVLATELSAGRNVQIEIKFDADAVALLAPEQTLEALQVVREAMSNALRHGGATALTLALHKDERQLCLLVQDNGHGFDAVARTGAGHGLANMEARANRLGATVKVVSTPDIGTRVLLTLPRLG